MANGDETDVSYARSIELPPKEIFKDLCDAKIFAMDIGGSLAKIAYSLEVENIRSRLYSVNKDGEDIDLQTKNSKSTLSTKEQVERSERIHFVKFETKYIEDSLDFIQKNLMHKADGRITIKATGGGAHKYTNLLQSKLDVEVEKLDEMSCLISGCNFLLNNVPNECFEFEQPDLKDKPEFHFKHLVNENIFPYLLVNIGSGVSIIKVESDKKFERIGGTSTGGGTFWGLGSLLTDANSFDELLAMTKEGKTKNIDMLVKDIYGGGYETMNLPGDLTASSFGKAARASRDQASSMKDKFRSPDIAKALLQMVSNDIGQISALYAQLHGLTRIYFGGYFIRGYHVTMRTISFAINFFSKGKIKALFLRHEGYLGAIGAFLHTSTPRNSGYLENFAESSGFSPSLDSSQFAKFELDRIRINFTEFPLLKDASKYQPDLLDLGTDDEGRQYWINIFETGVDKFNSELKQEIAEELMESFENNDANDDVNNDSPMEDYASPITKDDTMQPFSGPLLLANSSYKCRNVSKSQFVDVAIQSQCGQPDVEKRAAKFKKNFLERLNILKTTPYAFGQLTVRSLLDTRKQFLSSFSFCDPYLHIKIAENEQSLRLLAARLKYLDTLDGRELEIEIVKGIMAGNVFDWGAKESVRYLEDSQFGFSEAMKKLKQRPWLVDSVDTWVERQTNSNSNYNKVVVFVDNSGADIVLGLVPFARSLLKRGTKVILAANTYPAINDVIHSELVILCDRVADMCPIVRGALAEEQLQILETGSSSACLDLRRIEVNLAKEVEDADLVVLEGMGRCIHTNYNVDLSCDLLKCAVIKNPWVAQRLGGNVFDVIFQFTINS